jgi:hypothetical protein
MSDRPSISLSASAFARLSGAARTRGVSMSALVEAALVDLPPADVEPREVIAVSHRIYAMGGKLARRECQPINDTIEAAILAALDDAERFHAVARKRRRPMVAHAAVRR